MYFTSGCFAVIASKHSSSVAGNGVIHPRSGTPPYEPSTQPPSQPSCGGDGGSGGGGGDGSPPGTRKTSWLWPPPPVSGQLFTELAERWKGREGSSQEPPSQYSPGATGWRQLGRAWVGSLDSHVSCVGHSGLPFSSSIRQRPQSG